MLIGGFSEHPSRLRPQLTLQAPPARPARPVRPSARPRGPTTHPCSAKARTSSARTHPGSAGPRPLVPALRRNGAELTHMVPRCDATPRNSPMFREDTAPRSQAPEVRAAGSPGREPWGRAGPLVALPLCLRAPAGRQSFVHRSAECRPAGLRSQARRGPRAHALGYRLHAASAAQEGRVRPHWCRSSCIRARVASYRHLGGADQIVFAFQPAANGMSRNREGLKAGPLGLSLAAQWERSVAVVRCVGLAGHGHRQFWLPLIAVIALAVAFGYRLIGGSTSSAQTVQATLYVVGAVLLLVYCASLGMRLRRMDRWEREGRCRTCGYDRRGHLITEPCPECGSGGIQ